MKLLHSICMQKLTSSSLWFLIPLTKSCMFLSRTLSRFIFIFFRAILKQMALQQAETVSSVFFHYHKFFSQEIWLMEVVMWPATNPFFPTSLEKRLIMWPFLFRHSHGDTCLQWERSSSGHFFHFKRFVCSDTDVKG